MTRSPHARYIRSPQELPRNAGAVRVVNSAGLSGIGDVEPVRRAKLLALLRDQTAIAASPARGPLVNEIRRARIVVGSSLHVRIVASAYGVPRVSLRRSKPTRYARTWDPDMPYGVSLPALDAAAGAAMTAAERPEVAVRSAALVERAHRHLTSLAADVLARAMKTGPAHCPEAP